MASGDSTKPGINVGDAILTFIGDVTQLESAIDRVNAETKTKLEPARQSAQGVTEAFNGIGAAAEVTSVKVAEGFEVMYRSGMTYNEFTKQNIAAAKEFAGSTTAAMSLVGTSWQVVKKAAADGTLAQKQATDTVGASAKEAASEVQVAAAGMSQSWLNVARATVANTEAQQQLRQVLQMVREAGNQDAATMVALAQAHQRVAYTAAALSEAEKQARNEVTQTIKQQTEAITELVVAEQQQASLPIIAARPDATAGRSQSELDAEDAERTKAAYAEIEAQQVQVQESYAKTAVAAKDAAEAQSIGAKAAAGAAQANSQAQLQSAGAAAMAASASSGLALGWSAVAEAEMEMKESQAIVNGMLKDMASGTIPKTTRSMHDLAVAEQEAAEAAAKYRVALKSIGETGPNLREARGEIMSINKELNLGVDRHLAGWLARLPYVGAAMEAAFDATMVLVLIGILAEGVAKLVEWSERGEKLREGWIELNATFSDTTSGISEKIDEQQRKFIELTEGPVAAYDFALKHLRSTASESLQGIKTELDQAGEQFKEQAGWISFLSPWKESAKEFKKLYADLHEAQQKAKEDAPGDVFAQYRAMAKVTETSIEEVKARLKELDDYNKEMINTPETNQALVDLTPYQKKLEILERINKQLQLGQDLDKSRQDEAAKQEEKAKIARDLELGQARIAAEKQAGQARIALQDEQNRILFERGQISQQQELDALRNSENQKYQLERKSLSERLKLLEEDPTKNAAAIRQTQGELEALNLTHQAALLKIDQDGYKMKAAAGVAAYQEMIAQSKQGSQDRIDLEEALAGYLLAVWGEESEAYKQQLVKVADARRAFNETMRRLTQEQTKNEMALASDAAQSSVQYYQYMVQTFRATQAQMTQIQREAEEGELTRKRAALKLQLTTLGKDEIVAREQVNGQIALLDQQLEEKRKLWALQSADTLTEYLRQFGITSKEVYERQEQIAGDTYAHILLSGKATYQELLLSEMALLEATIARKAAVGEDVSAEEKTLDNLTNSLYKLNLAQGKVRTSGTLMQHLFKQLGIDVKLMGTTVSNISLMVAGAAAQMALAWAAGGVSVGEAARRMAAAVLQSVASYAFAKMIEQMALGFAAMSPVSPDFGFSGVHFTSAAYWGAVGAAASVAGGLIAGAGSGGGGGTNQPVQTEAAAGITQGNTTPTPATPTQQNVPHFAAGALFSGPTLAVIGDSLGNPSRSQGQIEAAMPLDDPEALAKIGAAMGPHIPRGSGLTVNVEGMISPDNLVKVVKQISHAVKNNDVTLIASNAFRVTKKA